MDALANRVYNSYDHDLPALVGKTVTKIQMNEEFLVFTTDAGVYAYTVQGDCCSRSYFYDFYGVERLLKNGPIREVGEVNLTAEDWTKTDDNDSVVVYGFKFVTEHPYFGEVTSVFSFRNDSNGYYGGWMLSAQSYPDDVPEIGKDTLL